MPKTIAERAEGYMDRIHRIYDEHMDMLEKMLDDESVSEDEVVRDMVLAEYNMEQLSALYELAPAEFCDEVGERMEFDDIDIWLDLIMREPEE